MAPQIIIVTGAASGMGLATAQTLFASGYSVALLDLSQPAIDAAIKTLAAAAGGNKAWGSTCDVSDSASLEVFFTKASTELGSEIYGVAHCAGILGQLGPVHEQPWSDIEKIVAVNFMGTVKIVSQAVKTFRKQGNAPKTGYSIVTIGSFMIAKPVPGCAIYSATKAAVKAFNQAVAKENAEAGIRINTVNPGSDLTLLEAVTLPELRTKCSAPAYSVGGLGDKVGASLVDIHGRITQMDALGVEHMILSEGLFVQADAEALATRANDYLSAECAKNPARFSAYGSVSMHDANDFQSVDGPDGVRFFDQPEYDIFWETIAKLDTVVYIHPRTPTPEIVEKFWAGRKWLNGASLSFTFGVASHVLGLCVNGVFDRFPNVKVMIGHGGEIIPYNLWRTNHRLELFARLRGMPMKHDLRHYLAKNIFITTSGFYSTPGLALALNEVGADNILFAIDHPYEEMEPATTWFDALQLNNNDKAKIGRTNAIKLLKLKLSL
ncbi:hypothetical protein RQP46_002358 [Phenoliferia psychrophenolica]